ncbi:unnamed protein product [Calicophoron daubneyi]|uniref:Alpha-1,3-glucosyltransferase n=1 Tax=Calicophoron daubneyi TaxID=300641 RepID=A0AAV2TX99_CALDB
MDADKLLKYCLPIFVGLSLRSAVLLHPHSGQNKPPLFGDYEAQRHWMEITTNLPTRTWYVNSSDNDLLYWGLDYPPVTAYHSWLMGKISEWLNPSWTKLLESRGTESYEHKVFMRYTVLLSDLFIFIPAALFYFYHASASLKSNNVITPFYACLLTLMYPGLILIDHGHYQYNCVSLGLFLACLSSFLLDMDLLGTFLFCIALGYKQMEFYHALPLFCYLLGKCIHSPLRSGLSKLLKLALTVVFTFFLVFFPFLTDKNVFTSVLLRMFPLNRGLYEDKVANFWCSTSPIIKWRSVFSQFDLVRLCAAAVLCSSLPVCCALLVSPKKSRLLYGLASCSLSFFLFSYHVHEKSILLVALPSLCMFPFCPFSTLLFALVSTLSMWPLYDKDSLIGPCMYLTLIYFVVGYTVIMRKSCLDCIQFSWASPNLLLGTILSGYVVLLLGHSVITPPAAYPDIFPLCISAYSFVLFFGFWIFWTLGSCRVK